MGRFSLFATMSLAAPAVALVILVDIATGQGPPILNAYMNRVPPTEYRQPPIPVVAYGRPEPYEPKKAEFKDYKEFEKAAIKDKEEYKSHEPYPDRDYKSDKSTPAPGVFSSVQNSMSNAWKSLSSLGRSKRGATLTTQSGVQSFEDLESRQTTNSGYLYFKVPRSLVCQA